MFTEVYFCDIKMSQNMCGLNVRKELTVKSVTSFSLGLAHFG